MLERGTYGVEWSNRTHPDDPSGLARVVGCVLVSVVVALGWKVVGCVRAARSAEAGGEKPDTAETGALPGRAPDTEPAVPAEVRPPEPPPPVEPLPAPPATPEQLGCRPAKVRNLLLRLEEAEKNRDVEMAISTIESLRALPGEPVADLDDTLARRLGVLNTRRLFTLKAAQWVSKLTVKRGDSASRLASEHGSTLASLAKLNGGNVDKLKIGQSIYVLNHPRFNLVVHRRARTADLLLNGKFFKRYDLDGSLSLPKDGAYEWREVSVPLKKATDRSELDVLLPRSTSVLVSEM